MTPDMRPLFVLAGLLTAALSDQSQPQSSVEPRGLQDIRALEASHTGVSKALEAQLPPAPELRLGIRERPLLSGLQRGPWALPPAPSTGWGFPTLSEVRWGQPDTKALPEEVRKASKFSREKPLPCWFIAGRPSPAPPGQLNTSSAERVPLEPGEQPVLLGRGTTPLPALDLQTVLRAPRRPLVPGANRVSNPTIHNPLPPPEHRALRLADGGGPCAGRVEILERGQWGSVCDDAWDLQDAHVVCQQLGCGWAVQALPGLHFAPGRGPIHRDQVNCSGAEAYLWDCPGRPGDLYCGHKEDAGVVCSEHQSWRLTGGADACEGQVEVHFRGVWSTVCDSEWYSSEAKVLCQTLGCGTVVERPKGLPHALSGRMYYSCKGEETTLSNCSWRFNNSNLCSQSLAARCFLTGSRSLLNLSTPEVPAGTPPVTVESSVTVKTEDKASRELVLLIPCIVLGVLLLGSLVSIVFILLRVKGKYALPVMVNHQHLPTTLPAGIHNYHAVPIAVPKEEVPKVPIQARAPPPEDSDSSSDTDYEHYDFSAQPPVALTTFYNSQRHRVTEEEAQQRRFQMPSLEEGLEELHASHVPAANPGHSVAEPPSLGPQFHPRSTSGSSTSSGEHYCNSPSSKLPPRNPQVFPSERSPLLEQPPNLELAGSQATYSAGPSADDSSSTSSGEWYQNFRPPPQPPLEEQFGYPGSPSPQPDSTDNEDYDDIGAV
ncbi:T-cell differentiation antigen CD6 [Carlito syrichta]|uniref:T-cell differentiation antigen CD6 n=1 Tax=Carlito syrichta TaxID=1868482 RepID=A0A3Q0DJX3_CARSF|nr:T-cell differentiation antigen CD6 [Carlito syrichta]